MPYLAVVAKMDIPPMTEITIDYTPNAKDDGEGRNKKQCCCGAAKCRGWLY